MTMQISLNSSGLSIFRASIKEDSAGRRDGFAFGDLVHLSDLIQIGTLHISGNVSIHV